MWTIPSERLIIFFDTRIIQRKLNTIGFFSISEKGLCQLQPPQWYLCWQRIQFWHLCTIIQFNDYAIDRLVVSVKHAAVTCNIYFSTRSTSQPFSFRSVKGGIEHIASDFEEDFGTGIATYNLNLTHRWSTGESQFANTR